MYAVIETGGKQYRVEVGTELEVELLDAASGESVAFDRVLLVADGEAASIGRPPILGPSPETSMIRRAPSWLFVSTRRTEKSSRRLAAR